MKQKFLLTGTLLLISAGIFAQATAPAKKEITVEIQAKGLGNSTWLFNKNISDLGAIQNYANGIGINYGLGANLYFGNIGVGIEGLMGNHQGSYTGTIEVKDSTGGVIQTKDYKSSVNLITTQIPLLFKLKSATGGYLEIGPQYNIISSAHYHRSGDGMNADTSVTSNYSSSYLSAVVGFGFKIRLGQSPLSLNAGVRLQCSFTDLKGVDALGNALNNSFNYKTYEGTYATTGGVVVALVYTIGGKKS